MHREPTPEYINSLIEKRYEAGMWNSDNGKKALSWRIVPDDFADTDRTFRNAWKDGRNGKPDHDMPKAREITRIHLRKERLKEFCRLDHVYRLAEEAGDQEVKREVATVKQKFRDVTDDPRIEAAQTVEELKALKLAELVPETVGAKYMDKMRFKTAWPLVDPTKKETT
jgi:hypothetical protein